MHFVVLLALAAVALALPVVPGIQDVDVKVRYAGHEGCILCVIHLQIGARSSEWYRAVQYIDEDTPRGGNQTFVQIASMSPTFPLIID